MSAVVKIHPHHGLTWFYKRKKHCHIRLRARMRLNIGIRTAEQFLRAVPGQILYHVHILAPAVIPFSRVAFGILVRTRTSHRCHHCLAHEVLGRNQFNVVVLPASFQFHCLRKFRIGFYNFFK